MSHVFWVPFDSIEVGAVITIDGDEGHHAVRVRRIGVGETVEVMNGAGTRAKGVVSTVLKASCEVTVTHIEEVKPCLPRITVVQALVKKDRADQAIELLTEVGVDAVIPWAAQRSITKEVPSKWPRIALESCKQSRQARLPDIAPLTTTDAVVDFINHISGKGVALLCHETATTAIAEVIAEFPSAQQIGIGIGPEGGLTDEETARFIAAGARKVRLGPSVLRAATAGAVAASIVSALTSRWQLEDKS